MKHFHLKVLIVAVGFLQSCDNKNELPIDRKAVVSRHNVELNGVDTMGSLTLGNGRFAMTMDVTGLQTFADAYENGVPLGTQSEWGWHSFPPERDYSIDETLVPIQSHGREVPYARQWPANTPQGAAANYIRQNPHRIHLAQVGWEIIKKDGTKAELENIEAIDQKLDLWKGELISRFEVEGEPIEVISLVDPSNEQLHVSVKSPLIQAGRLGLSVNYPFPTDQFLDVGNQYDSAEQKRLTIKEPNSGRIQIKRSLDSTVYHTEIRSSQSLESSEERYGFIFQPNSQEPSWDFSISFSPDTESVGPATFDEAQAKVNKDYEQFWKSGGMMDFVAVDDKRAKELERRMILSLYLTKVNCGGMSPPQETGLTYNSWYGKPHMEMTWWHGVHFALWGRTEVLEKHMDWYLRNDSVAKVMAERQGFEGVRWQKMTDNDGGETVSSVGSYLIWQQPHIIYFSELIYRANPSPEVLSKYERVIEQTADFMADFAWYDEELERYILGPGVIPAQERFDPQETFNPTYELAYWRWALEAAQQWRTRMGQERNPKWDEVLKGLSPLPEMDGLYLATESAPDSYTHPEFMTDHPIVLGAYGMLPATDGLDTEVMRQTFDKVWEDWQWEDTWGWDFPMTAMTAARLGRPERAVESLLMPITTNTYLVNGHNYQSERLRIYLPGNGGLLTALGLMAKGADELPENSGFPPTWKVRHEGLVKMP